MGGAYRLAGHLGELLQQVGIRLAILHWNLLAVLDGKWLVGRGWGLVLNRNLLAILGIAIACGNRDICNRLCSVGCIRGFGSSVDRLGDATLLAAELGPSVDGVLLLVGQVIAKCVQITASVERNLGGVVDTLSLTVVVDLPGYRRRNVSIILGGFM